MWSKIQTSSWEAIILDFRSIPIENSRQHFEAPHLVNWAVINSRNPPPNFYRRGQARQYIIDTVICFGLFIAAVRSLPKGLT